MNVHAAIAANPPTGLQVENFLDSARSGPVFQRAKIVIRADGSEGVIDDGRGAALTIGIERSEGLSLSIGTGDPARMAGAVAALVETLTASERNGFSIRLSSPDEAVTARLKAEGLAIGRGEDLVVRPELVWQRAALWLPDGDAPPFAELHVMSEGRRHPIRAPKPRGLVYERHIPWLDRVLTFRALDVERDLPAFNRWMNDPRVDEVWEEAGDLETHRRSLEERAEDPHLLTLIGEFDGVPFGYFELYWAKENRLGPLYDADDYDRGWHVLIGEDAFRGRVFITAWLPSLMHYMFLSDPRTRRIVGEPRWTHAQQIRNLDKAGFSKIKHVDFAHKRALLVMLLRERFFGDHLWAPEQAPA